jgi:hypothetical protein
MHQVVPFCHEPNFQNGRRYAQKIDQRVKSKILTFLTMGIGMVTMEYAESSRSINTIKHVKTINMSDRKKHKKLRGLMDLMAIVSIGFMIGVMPVYSHYHSDRFLNVYGKMTTMPKLMIANIIPFLFSVNRLFF